MNTSHRQVLQTAASRAIAFRDTTATRPPKATATATELCAAFGGPTPERGTRAEDVVHELAAAAEPGLMGPTGPRFFGWVMGASHTAGVAADWLTSAWGQNSGNYMGSPAAAMAEKVAGRWLLDILDLPLQSSVGFVTGATMANFVCLAAARSHVLRQVGWDVETDGLFGSPRLHVCVGADAHATVLAALQYLGLGRERAISIATDDAGRMCPDDLAAVLEQLDGPKIVIAQAGQINTGAFDPFEEIARICRHHGAWLHVDGAFGLWARACPETAHLTAGIQNADSWATDGHKWLQVPYDSGFAIVRRADPHRRAMAITASYLPTANADEYDPAQYVPELSRRARGFAVWAVIKTLGRTGVADMVRRHTAYAARLAGRLSRESGIEVLNEVGLNQVIVGFGTDASPEQRDELTRAVIERLQAQNEFFVGGAEWRGRWVMRISVISAPTTQDDIDAFGEAIIRAWRTVRVAHTPCLNEKTLTVKQPAYA